MKRKIVFATNNKHKLEEVRSVVGDKFEILSLEDIDCFDDIEETGTTLEENAFIKAMYVKNNYGLDCFADDTGLEVDILDGRPGVYSARYAGENHDSEANIDKLLSELQNEKQRDAKFRTVICLLLGNDQFFFQGEIIGRIIEERLGKSGFGYDPIFKPEGYEQTFAQLGDSVKNGISHRALAVKKLCDFLVE